jgi:hypothetical protein
MLRAAKLWVLRQLLVQALGGLPLGMAAECAALHAQVAT